MPTSLLVLSDIHFGQLSCSSDFALPPNNANEFQNAVSMKASLIETAANSGVDAIVVTGDLTSIASPAEFIGAVQAVNEIRAGCGVAAENVFFTFGNHDTNWRICASATTRLRSLRMRSMRESAQRSAIFMQVTWHARTEVPFPAAAFSHASSSS